MMYVKLIYRNLKRSTKEYAIYIMTLVLAITLLYAFNGVALSSEVKGLSNTMEVFGMVAISASILIVFVLAWLVYYISKFILEKRSREFGMYMLMGMTRKQVSRMFLLEQVSMGIIAYIIGCVLGVFLFQIMQAVVLNMFIQNYQFEITFSFTSAWLTLLYFILMFVLELFRESYYLRKKSIHDLLYSEKKNEVHKSDKKRFIVFVVLGVLLYFIGLVVLNSAFNEPIVSDGFTLLLCIVFIVLSIVFIYLGLSYVITLFLNRRKQTKYKGNVLYLSSQICSRLKTSRAVLSLLTILTISSFLLVGMGLKFHQAQKDSESMVPFDIQVTQDLGIDLDVTPITDYLNKNHISFQDLQYQNYEMEHNAKELVKGIKWEERYTEASDFVYIKYSDYCALLKMLDKEPLKMEKDEYILATQRDFEDTISKNAQAYTFDNLHFSSTDTREFGEERYNALVFVVPDELLETKGLNAVSNYVVKSEVASSKAWEDAIEPEFTKHNSKEMVDEDGATWVASNYMMVKAEWITANLSSTVLLVFTLVYIAIILSCVSATVLAIQQMSDVWKQKASYIMLWKLGVDKREIYRILRKQIAVYFFVPFIIPVLYIFPIARISDQLFEMSYSRGSIVPLVGIAVLFYFVVYFVYYLLAYFNCKHSIINSYDI